ncbi:aminoglycoside phosphotransferase family protein [Pseudalkalibacillus sp. SCS-8]|uniref:phosphotransferase family protein n=1 Tax=Pseudalkalibacillus nanhaiensis TaxID=3115291 RepID=UPI0032D9FE0D
MTTKILFSTNKLGAISNEQLQWMLDRFNLGKLISSAKTREGVMSQTMFVTSTEGQFVLKGNPLYPGQLQEEKYFVDNLNQNPSIHVPHPYQIDEQEDIFGWSYALMPCLSGEHLQPDWPKQDKLMVAEALAETLKEMHSWKVEQFGELEPSDFQIKSFEGSYKKWLYDRIRYWLNDAKKYSVITREDFDWVEQVLRSAEESFQELSTPAFVMGDFKPANVLLQKGSKGWTVSGVFDFTNAYFGDPVADLVKMLTIYIDQNQLEIAERFLSVYLETPEDKEAYVNRICVHMLQQRILDWGCFKAIGQVTWDDDLPFSKWAAPYIQAATELTK